MRTPNYIQFNNIGPFREPQSLILNDGQTLISGSNGLGKSMLSKCIYDHIVRYTAYNREIPKWAILMDEQSNMLRDSWFRKEFLCSELIYVRNELEALVSSAVNKMLELKIKNKFTKFHNVIADTELIEVSINSDGTFSFKTNAGLNINNLFLAYGETTVVTLASANAIRSLLKCELPFITDSIFSYLDRDLKPSCYEFITNMFRPTIILEYPDFFEASSLREHYKIDYDTVLGSSLIKNEP